MSEKSVPMRPGAAERPVVQRQASVRYAPNAGTQAKVDKGDIPPQEPDFWFRGGCTVLVDLDRGAVRYCIGKGLLSDSRLADQRKFAAATASPQGTYFGDPRRRDAAEPFAMLHRSLAIEEEPLG